LKIPVLGAVEQVVEPRLSERKGLFEVADKGTLFLDEVSEMSPRVQEIGRASCRERV